jgi:hypothetical protein
MARSYNQAWRALTAILGVDREIDAGPGDRAV